MKKLALSLCALAALGTGVFAGTETYSKESQSVAPPPCPQWYADNEFNLSLSGVYAFTQDPSREDTYLAVDHAWGGALDAKYFMHRYFGLGLQGFIARANTHEIGDNGFVRFPLSEDDTHAVGGILGTLTLRFPINCSRFAPYVWLGGGGIFGGGRAHDFFLDPNQPLGFVRREFDQSDSRALGQIGGGLEIRFTPHLGLLNDFSWNIVSGSNNNFGMARTGLNFAF
jgi:Outer membrane protein beta-barrel domain